MRISDLQTEHIDKFTCRLLMDQCKSIEQEYAESQRFIRTVKSELIKSDIAAMLSRRWKKDESFDDVKKHLNVQIDSKEEIKKEIKSVSDGINAYMEMLKHPGYTLGFPGIDASFGKLRKKKVFLVGAYSKVGKTDFLIEIVLHSALRLKLRCVIFSMEMEQESFMQRVMAKLLGVHKDRLEELMLSPDSANYITQVREKLEEYICIYDTNDLTLDDIKERVIIARDDYFEAPVDRVFVDYFQYLKNTSEYAGIAASAKAMKPFAKQMNVQLFMLSQFNREGNPWDEPSIRSFRGGNDMESSMDYALLLWRPGLKPGLGDIDKKQLKYLTKIKIVSRDGLNGGELFDMYFNPKTGKLQEEPYYDPEIPQKVS